MHRTMTRQSPQHLELSEHIARWRVSVSQRISRPALKLRVEAQCAVAPRPFLEILAIIQNDFEPIEAYSRSTSATSCARKSSLK